MLRARSIVLLLVLVLLAACGGDPLPSNDRLSEIFREGRTGVWVSGHGPVTQILPDESGPDPQQRFVVEIAPGLSVIVHHSLVHSERVPAERGEIVVFQGRYEWSGRGGVISLTHHDPAQPGEGGWIEYRGRRYD